MGSLWNTVTLVSFWCAGVLGVVGGVMLLRRRQAAVVLQWIYALGVAGGFAVVVTNILRTWARVGGLDGRFALDMAARVEIGLAYPVLVMIWFSRRAVRRHVRVWRTRADRLATRPAGPVWPTVLGTLALFWGATGAVAALLTGIAMLLPDGIWCLRGRLNGFVGHAATWSSLILCGLSIAWGVLLRRRRRAGVVLCWVFLVASAACTLLTPLPAVINLLKIWRKYDAWFLLTRAASLAVRTLLLLAWPTFLLIWLSRATIRAQVRSWGTRSGGLVPGGAAPGLREARREAPSPVAEQGPSGAPGRT